MGREGDEGANHGLRQDHRCRHGGSSTEGQKSGWLWTRIEHEHPKQDAVDHHAPIHHLIKLRIQHGSEVNPGDQPQGDDTDKEKGGKHRLLKHAQDSQQQWRFDQPAKRAGQSPDTSLRLAKRERSERVQNRA